MEPKIAPSSRALLWMAISARTGEIVHIGRERDVTESELDELSASSEGGADSTATTGESEYWGTTESGSAWRVHVAMDC
jgi:hypothetical protein